MKSAFLALALLLSNAICAEVKTVLTDNSHHCIPQEEPELVIKEANELLERVRASKKL